MTFVSLLFADTPRPDESAAVAPEHFGDLALDHVVAAAVAGRDEHHLTPLRQLPLRDRRLIEYRQAVFAEARYCDAICGSRRRAPGCRSAIASVA